MTLNGRSSLTSLVRRRTSGSALDAERRRASYDRELAALLDRVLSTGGPETERGCAVAFVGVANEGETSAAASLAVYAAQRRRLRTLLVDANEASPSQHRRFETPPRPGLVEVLRGEAIFDDALHATVYGRLDVLPLGEGPIPFANEAVPVREALDQARRQFALTLIDLADVRDGGGLRLAAAADRCVLVADARNSRRSRLEERTSRLRSAGATLAGLVLDRCEIH